MVPSAQMLETISVASSKVAGFFSIKTFPISLTKSPKAGDSETKSVSELTSKITASSPLSSIQLFPSAATRLAFLATLLKPFSRSQTIAFSTSFSQATIAFLQSMSPAPVRSLSCLINSICADDTVI